MQPSTRAEQLGSIQVPRTATSGVLRGTDVTAPIFSDRRALGALSATSADELAAFDEQRELELNALAVVANDQSEATALELQGTRDENVVERSVPFENVDSERNNDGSGFIVDDETQGASGRRQQSSGARDRAKPESSTPPSKGQKLHPQLNNRHPARRVARRIRQLSSGRNSTDFRDRRTPQTTLPIDVVCPSRLLPAASFSGSCRQLRFYPLGGLHLDDRRRRPPERSTGSRRDFKHGHRRRRRNDERWQWGHGGRGHGCWHDGWE